MFDRLRVKLTLLYSGLFAAILLLISLAMYFAIAQIVRHEVREQLTTSATVFDRVWALRTDQLENGAWLLSRDYGFRQAVASGDDQTIHSALDNLRLRLGLDLALLIGVDGKVTAAGKPTTGQLDAAVIKGLQTDDDVSGVLQIGDESYQVVAVPARAPTTIGWVVFASRLDGRQMRSLERLAAIPLHASVLHRHQHGAWRDGAKSISKIEQVRIDERFAHASDAPIERPIALAGSNGEAVALVKSLNSLDPDNAAVLVLEYPLSRAFAPYQLLIYASVAIALLGLIGLFVGSWRIALGVTRPISALKDAARRFTAGERVEVPITTRDEVGALAESFNVMARDIWQREEELKSTKAFLDTVVESLPAMLVVKDDQQRFVLLNRAGEALLGMDRSELLGKTDHDIFPADQADAFVQHDQVAWRSGQLHLTPEEPIQTAQGLRYLQTKKIAIPDPQGRPRYLMAISEDITERKFAAEALERARDAAEAANRAKSSFLANMSHEVRTPLNGVLGVTSVLTKSGLKPNQQAMVEIIENSATVLQRVLNDVLDLAKVEAGRLQIVSEVFSLEDAVDAVSSSARLACGEKGVGFRLDFEPGLAGLVSGDRVRLEQVLGNLLSNAVKFTSAGEVRLAVSAPGGEADPQVRFEVSDTGIGFDPALTEELFSPFQQADNSITRRFGGTGLGLSISRQLAQAMGGDLTASGVPGQGATFVLTAPFVPAVADGETQGGSRPEAAHSAEPTATRTRQAVRVLLADDHETNRAVVSLILGSVGIDLVTVEDGCEALAAFEAETFDIVLMDLQMPVMDGLTAIRLIRQLETETGRSRTPILVLSANAMAEHVDSSQEAGADGHLAKPITAPALIAALEATLESDRVASRHQMAS